MLLIAVLAVIAAWRQPYRFRSNDLKTKQKYYCKENRKPHAAKKRGECSVPAHGMAAAAEQSWGSETSGKWDKLGVCAVTLGRVCRGGGE